jgi:predicted SnoaL-like aldol condensation-catalyzing enzyme
MQPETNGLIKGKSAMHDWWQGSFDRLPTLKYTIVELHEESDLVYMTYIRSVLGEADTTINEMLQIKNGKIVFSKVL